MTAVTHATTTGWRTMRSLRRAVAAFRPDVLHVQCFGPNGAYATALSRLCRVPLVVTLQGETLMDDADIFDDLAGPAGLAAGRAALRRRRHRLLGLHPGRRRGPVRAGRRVGAGSSSTGCRSTGRTTPRAAGRPAAARSATRPTSWPSGGSSRRRASTSCWPATRPWTRPQRTADLVIGGAGPALERLEAQAEESGIGDRVHFVGRLTREQVAAAMAGAAVFVMPSRLEPFGIVVLEGWRAGTAVVATDRGGAPEFVRDGVDGLLVDPFDTAAVAGVLGRVLVRRRPAPIAGRRRTCPGRGVRVAADRRGATGPSTRSAGRR